MPSLTDPIRGLARQGAQLLRVGAALLEQVAGTGEPKSAPPARPAAPKPPRQAGSAPKDLDDVTIARKVEAAIFGDGTVPKGKIDVNVVGGVAYLRGEVKRPADVKRVAALAEAVPEVRRVENLLHLPKTPARRPKPKADPKLTPPGRVSSEVPAPGAEPSPAELARKGKGRQPAPLGTNGHGGGTG